MFANFEKYQVILDDTQIGVLSGRQETSEFLDEYFKISAEDKNRLFEGHSLKYGKNIIYIKTCGSLRSPEFNPNDQSKKDEIFLIEPVHRGIDNIKWPASPSGQPKKDGAFLIEPVIRGEKWNNAGVVDDMLIDKPTFKKRKTETKKMQEDLINWF